MNFLHSMPPIPQNIIETPRPTHGLEKSSSEPLAEQTHLYTYQSSSDFKIPEESINIINKIWGEIPRITYDADCPLSDQIVWKVMNSNLVFIHGDFVFKGGHSKRDLDQRFANMEIGRKVILEHNLDSLVVPKAKILSQPYLLPRKRTEYQDIYLIAEEKLDIEELQDEELSEVQKKSLEKAVEQLVIFICLTDLSDVSMGNVPLIKFPNGEIKIALVDLEFRDSSIMGLVGQEKGLGRGSGLLRTFSQLENLNEKVAKIASKYLEPKKMADLRRELSLYYPPK